MNFKQNRLRYLSGLVAMLAIVFLGTQYDSIFNSGSPMAAVYSSVRPARPTIIRDGPSGVGTEDNAPVKLYALNIKKSGGAVLEGADGGVVVSKPSGINCGKTCSSRYKNGTFVTLSASSNKFSKFSSWTIIGGSNLCPDATLPCTIEMNSDVTVIAKYTKKICSRSLSKEDRTLLDKIGTILGKRLAGSEAQSSIVLQVVNNKDLSVDDKDSYIRQIRSSICLFREF